MKNLGQMMKQAQQMQTKMAEMQEALEGVEIAGQSGGGMVQVTLTGKGVMKGVKIDPSLVDDIEMLEDLVTAAMNDAVNRVKETSEQRMMGMTQGMKLPPGFKLPF